MLNRRMCSTFLLAMAVSYIAIGPDTRPARAQEDIAVLEQELATKVFLDVSPRYEEYIKQEIPFVNYVRDRMQADVHVMVTTVATGSNGTQHTITFTGLKDFAADNDTLSVITQQMDTEEQVRQDLTSLIKLGLIRYVCQTPVAENIRISYFGGVQASEQVVDNWDYWVFNIDTNTRLNGEETSKSTSLRGTLSADRVTPDWKISLSAGSNYNERNYDSEYLSYNSITRSHNFRSLVVKSITDHWSVGGFGEWDKSSVNNLNNAYSIAPAIEYNVFPYSESTFHEFRFLYRAQYTNNDYLERTIFLKDSEELYSQSLEATYEIKEQWGSIRTTLEGAHYFHDFERNHVELNCNFNIRLLEGLSLNLFGSVSQIDDDLSIPGGGLSTEEILLNQKKQSTSYDYSVTIGLRYSFGSIFSNVVNPRFGPKSPTGGGGFGGF